MLHNLKVFRVYKKMNQREFAKKIGYSENGYHKIETEKSRARAYFWKMLQMTFRLSDKDIEFLKMSDKKWKK